MNVGVKVKLNPYGEWLPALLTNERSESSYGLPVVVVNGENFARGSAEVYCIQVADPEYRKAAERAGYLVF